jgi:hypothetical protein
MTIHIIQFAHMDQIITLRNVQAITHRHGLMDKRYIHIHWRSEFEPDRYRDEEMDFVVGSVSITVV